MLHFSPAPRAMSVLGSCVLPRSHLARGSECIKPCQDQLDPSCISAGKRSQPLALTLDSKPRSPHRHGSFCCQRTNSCAPRADFKSLRPGPKAAETSLGERPVPCFGCNTLCSCGKRMPLTGSILAFHQRRETLSSLHLQRAQLGGLDSVTFSQPCQKAAPQSQARDP